MLDGPGLSEFIHVERRKKARHHVERAAQPCQVRIRPHHVPDAPDTEDFAKGIVQMVVRIRRPRQLCSDNLMSEEAADNAKMPWPRADIQDSPRRGLVKSEPYRRDKLALKPAYRIEIFQHIGRRIDPLRRQEMFLNLRVPGFIHLPQKILEKANLMLVERMPRGT
jgi:hypothetical protein